MEDIRIGDYSVGPSHRPFIVAEMSGNHNQSLERALEIIDRAAKAGVHAVKIQTYTADTMTLDIDEGEFFINDPASLWHGISLYRLYQQAHTPWQWHKPIFDRCKELGLLCFSTPFDETAVDFLESLDVPCYKVASFENNHLPLIRKIARTKKPMIISTGLASTQELAECVEVARDAGCEDLILLKCTSSYPASPLDSHLRSIPHMRDLFGCEVGLSDHTLGVGVAIAAVALGATLIEKHFTLSRTEGGVDAAFSLEPEEMRNLVLETRRAFESLGGIRYGVTQNEKRSLIFKRSIYVAKDMKAGEKFSTESLRIIRPGYGLAPKYLDVVLGRKAKADIRRGTPLTWDLVG